MSLLSTLCCAALRCALQGYAIKKDGVHVQPQSENRHSKVAFVEFVSADEAVRALVSCQAGAGRFKPLLRRHWGMSWL